MRVRRLMIRARGCHMLEVSVSELKESDAEAAESCLCNVNMVSGKKYIGNAPKRKR